MLFSLPNRKGKSDRFEFKKIRTIFEKNNDHFLYYFIMNNWYSIQHNDNDNDNNKAEYEVKNKQTTTIIIAYNIRVTTLE